MPAAPTTVREFSDLVVRSRLLTEDQLKSASHSLASSGNDANDLNAIRRVLVANKGLTDYQATLLSRGHAEGFFLNEYRILDLLAKGRFSGVYKAIDATGRIVAIKVLPASKAKDAEVLARFRREAKLLTKLDHPNVVRAINVGEANGRNYLVQEYLDGDTLEELLAQSKSIAPVPAARIILQAFTGLQHIHERGMIHRDLNPSNLMLIGSPDGNRVVKILDIGLGKAVFDEQMTAPVDDPSRLTNDGVLIGTSDYLAPEQARQARSADIRSDIYSLGCVFFHALTGQPPFPDKSVLNQVMRHAIEAPRPLSEFLTEVPTGLQHVLNWMLAKEPAQRFATPQKAVEALQLFLKNTPANRSAKLVRPIPVTPKKEEPAPPTSIPVGKLEPVGKKSEPKLPELPRSAPAEPVVVEAKIDVELISVTLPEAPIRERSNRPRGLFDFDRRDALMATMGGLLVVAAIIVGWGISKAMRHQPPAPDINAPKEG